MSVRITVTVDEDLLAAGRRAVADGRAPSVSAWVNTALADRAAAERRLASMAEAVRSFEAEHGAFTEEELAARRRADRDAAAALRLGADIV